MSEAAPAPVTTHALFAAIPRLNRGNLAYWCGIVGIRPAGRVLDAGRWQRTWNSDAIQKLTEAMKEKHQ